MNQLISKLEKEKEADVGCSVNYQYALVEYGMLFHNFSDAIF